MINNISILGAGWLGFELAKKLKTDKYELKLSSRNDRKLLNFKTLGFDSYKMDLVALDENSPFFQTGMLIFTVPPSGYPENYEECLQLLVGILEKKKIPILYCSSISVYGDSVGKRSENSQLSAETNSSKKIIETEKLFLNSKVNCRILRMGGLVGNKRHPVYYLSGKENLPAAGHAVNLLHLSDATGAICHLINKKNRAGVYNCCSPEHPNRKDFYTFIANKLLLALPHFDKNDSSEGKIVSSEKLILSEFSFRYPNPYMYPLE